MIFDLRQTKYKPKQVLHFEPDNDLPFSITQIEVDYDNKKDKPIEYLKQYSAYLLGVLKHMKDVPEYRELITKLKTSDRHFSHLFDKHNQLDAKILRMENHQEPSTPEQIEILKKEKLLIKDQIYAVLKKASA